MNRQLQPLTSDDRTGMKHKTLNNISDFVLAHKFQVIQRNFNEYFYF